MARVLARSEPAYPFNPAGLRGFDSLFKCQLWLDAGQIQAADGAGLSSWPDRSGFGRNATGINSPTYTRIGPNGRPCVNFNGTNQAFSVPDATNLEFQSRLYCIAVLKMASTTAMAILQKGATAGSPNYLWFLNHNSAGTVSFFLSGAFRDGTAGAISASTWSIVEAWWDGANVYFAVNGTAAGSPADATANTTSADSLFIGQQGSTNTNPFSGSMAELLMYGDGTSSGNGQIDTNERARMRRYLGTKYGIATA